MDIRELAGPILTAFVAVWGTLENRRASRLEADRTREAERIAGIVEERRELRDENKQLRTDLRAEIDRLKTEVAQVRRDLAASQRDADMWRERYEREIANNLPREEKIAALTEEVSRLREEVAVLRAAQVPSGTRGE